MEDCSLPIPSEWHKDVEEIKLRHETRVGDLVLKVQANGGRQEEFNNGMDELLRQKKVEIDSLVPGTPMAMLRFLNDEEP